MYKHAYNVLQPLIKVKVHLFSFFIADPLVFGFTVKAAKARETAPIVAYARAALRVCALASILPSRQTR